MLSPRRLFPRFFLFISFKGDFWKRFFLVDDFSDIKTALLVRKKWDFFGSFDFGRRKIELAVESFRHFLDGGE